MLPSQLCEVTLVGIYYASKTEEHALSNTAPPLTRRQCCCSYSLNEHMGQRPAVDHSECEAMSNVANGILEACHSVDTWVGLCI